MKGNTLLFARLPFRPLSLLTYLLFAALLFGSWVYGPTRVYWDLADRTVYQTLNNTLHGHPTWQWIVGCLSVRPADLFFDSVMVAITLWGFFRDRSPKTRAAAKVLFIGFYIYLCIKILNRIVIHLGDYHCRNSPTLFFPDAFSLASALNWPAVKDFSDCSFPGDHAMSFLLWASLTYSLFDRKVGRIAWIAALLFCLPRLINGAHWMTDQLVGSATFVLLAYAFAFTTPFSEFCLRCAERFFQLFTRNRVRK